MFCAAGGWQPAAAALCLVAAGAVVLGLFHPMSAANETNALVQKYGEVLDEPLTAEINGHTVSVKALLRGQYTLRILYDVDNARGMEADDLVWDTANFTLYKPKGASERKWDYGASNVDVGPISGYAVGRGMAVMKQARTTRYPALWIYPFCTRKATIEHCISAT